MEFDLQIDPQYIALVILLTETIVKYFGSKIKNKGFVALGVATLVGIGNFTVHWSDLVDSQEKYDFIYSMLVNYAIATSFYELFLKKLKTFVGAKIAGTYNVPQSATETHQEPPQMEDVAQPQQVHDDQEAAFDQYSANIEEITPPPETGKNTDVRSIIDKYTKGGQ